MRIGSKVRFLNQTGGGIVVGFAKKGWVTVQDEDGFEFPIPEKECVVIEESVVAKEEVNIQTKDGDKLNIALIYTKSGNEYSAILVNECNFNIFVTYSNLLKEENSAGSLNTNNYVTSFDGELLPYEHKEILKFKQDYLNNFSKRVLFRAIPFKKAEKFKEPSASKHMLKPVIEQEFVLDPTNLLKESMFRANEYVAEKGYVISIVNENAEALPLMGDIKEREIKQALKEKFEGEKNLSGKKVQKKERITNDLIRFSNSGIMEVDLHADALLDSTIGMDNTAILKYQLEKFNEAMTAVLHKRGEKIVFIHGKGDGVLRKALLNELKTKYSRCKWQDASFKEYGYGATLVIIGA